MTILDSNVDAAEIAKFNEQASTWWDKNGAFKPLHKVNPLRTNYIDERATVVEKNVIDIGCGGGILCEALAQRGAKVTGIDMGEGPLEIAKLHALESKLSIDYHKACAEKFADHHPAQFDIVTCLEMLEHVPNPASIVRACAQLCRNGGDIFFSTLNRNPKAYALAIIGAEYIMQMLPKGTHDYKKFIKPSELSLWCRQADLELINICGIVYNPIVDRFSLKQNDVDVNYIVHARKKS